MTSSSNPTRKVRVGVQDFVYRLDPGTVILDSSRHKEKTLFIMMHPDNQDLTPTRANPTDAGLDLCCAEDSVVIAPGERKLVGTGVHVAIDEGCAGFLFARSGNAHKRGASLTNCVGVIDHGYRGEVKASIINQDKNAPLVFTRGDRIAQLLEWEVSMESPVDFSVDPQAELTRLFPVNRGGGFGSSGQ